jgi:hypothetical protein
MPLQPTEVLTFGNAKLSTPLMQSVQSIGIDLPLKAHSRSVMDWVLGPNQQWSVWRRC